MLQPFIRTRGALHDVDPAAGPPADAELLRRLANGTIPPNVVELVPEPLARENLIMPLDFDGETLTCAAVRPDNLALQDKLRFILAKNVRFLPAQRELIVAAINSYYGQTETESVDSMLTEFTDTAVNFPRPASIDLECAPPAAARGRPFGWAGAGTRFKRGMRGMTGAVQSATRPAPGADQTRNNPGASMFFYTVEEGQRVLMVRPDGTMQVVVGPQRVWR